jgi:hypothetical protein
MNVKAQSIENYGVKIGVVTSNQDNRYHIPDNTFDAIATFHPNKNFIGFTIGLYAGFLNYAPFSFVFEGNYTQKGYREEYIFYNEWTGIHSTDIYTKRFDYLNFSLLLKTKVAFKMLSPYLLVGPRLDVSLANKNSFYDNNITGFVVGIGSEITLYKTRLLTEVTYDFSLSNIHEDRNVTISYESYVFRLGILL